MFVVTNPIEHVRAFDYDGISGVTHVPGASKAGASFGNATVYMEKFVERPQHIEIQVMGDRQGNVIHFGERECSIQRRHQKVWAKTPAGRAEILSPMLGKVVKLLAGEGEEVAKGQGLVVVEAMKMENELKSPKDGTVTGTLVEEGQAVEAGAVPLVVE